MTPETRTLTRKDIQRDEGYRQFPYLDCCGKPWRACVCARKGQLTIGWGRNLDGKGISRLEAEAFLDHDLYDAEQDARRRHVLLLRDQLRTP